MNRLKRYLPILALKLMYDSLILSHLQLGITNWGFDWDRISKLQKRALRIMTNSKYDAHTEPLFKQLHLLKVNDIFDVQCLKFWYKFVNTKLPNYFKDMFKYNYELHDIGTRSHDRLHLYPTRTSGARNVLRHHIPELLNKFPEYLRHRFKTHNLHSISYHIKCYFIDLYSYNCSFIDCYIFATIMSVSDKSINWKLEFRGRPVIIGCCPSSRTDNFGSGSWFGGCRWFPRYSND